MGGTDIGTAVNTGNGQFTLSSSSLFGQGQDTQNPEIQTAVADFNGDGKQDIVCGGEDDTVQESLASSVGTFPTMAAVASAPGQIVGVAAGGFNRGGNQDLTAVYVGTSQNHERYVGIASFLGTGKGTFSHSVFAPLSLQIGTYPTGGWGPVVTGDFNGDGRADWL